MEEKEGWHFVVGTKESHWIDLYWFEQGHPWAKVAVKWDGCIHFNTVVNEPYTIGKEPTESQCSNYLHICDIDSLIKQLEALKAAAKAHFGQDWPC